MFLALFGDREHPCNPWKRKRMPTLTLQKPKFNRCGGGSRRGRASDIHHPQLTLPLPIDLSGLICSSDIDAFFPWCLPLHPPPTMHREVRQSSQKGLKQISGIEHTKNDFYLTNIIDFAEIQIRYQYRVFRYQINLRNLNVRITKSTVG